ncbi:MAG: histidine phosphatase family protein [Nanobdellota archaeon]
MVQLILIRHGQKEKESEDAELTFEGERQAKQLATYLKGKNIDKVFVSDMLRAKQTLKPYLHIINDKVDVVTSKKLREIYRVLVGGPTREGTPKAREEYDRKRADDMYEMLIAQEGTIAVFIHGNLIRYFLSKAMKCEPSNWWFRLRIDNASISCINKRKYIQVKEINNTSYLDNTD